MNELVKYFEALEARIAAQEARIAALEAEVAELKNRPAPEPQVVSILDTLFEFGNETRYQLG